MSIPSINKKLVVVAILLAITVVTLGAFTRLSHAGLGCPDWPGCYGFIHIPTHVDDIAVANEAFPEQPYQFEKAWPEMVHRYFASTLGLLILILAVLTWRSAYKPALKHISFLLALVIFQGILGKWTVTMKLHPLVVMSHLAGGFTTFSLLVSLFMRYQFQMNSPFNNTIKKQLRSYTLVALCFLVLQILLGGWTSANYAAMVCLELPICQGEWLAQADFASAFKFWGHEADNFEFGVLSQEARIAIHALHRIGAMVATLAIVTLIVKLYKVKGHSLARRFAHILSILLTVQVLLGINNIESHLPLANATAHNAFGAILLATIVALLTLLVMPEKKIEGRSRVTENGQ